jgi:hypothetical protein
MEILELGAFQFQTQYLQPIFQIGWKRQQSSNAVASLLPLQTAILGKRAACCLFVAA